MPVATKNNLIYGFSLWCCLELLLQPSIKCVDIDSKSSMTKFLAYAEQVSWARDWLSPSTVDSSLSFYIYIYIYIYIIYTIHIYHHHIVLLVQISLNISLTIRLYHPTLLAGLLEYIRCSYRTVGDDVYIYIYIYIYHLQQFCWWWWWLRGLKFFFVFCEVFLSDKKWLFPQSWLPNENGRYITNW